MARRTRTAWSIKTYLALLVAAVAAPLAAILGYSIYLSAEANAREATARVLGLAQVTAAHTEELVLRTQGLAGSLSRHPWIVALDRDRCQKDLADPRLLDPGYANLVVVDHRGTIVCAADRTHPGVPGSLLDSNWFNRVQRTNQPLLAEPAIDPLSGRWVSVYTHPLRDAAGSFSGAIALGIDLRHLAGAVQHAQLQRPTPWSATRLGAADLAATRPTAERRRSQPNTTSTRYDMNALTTETAKLQRLVDEVTMAATGCINGALGITLAMQRVIELAESTTHRTMKELSKEVNVIALNLAIDAVKLNEQAGRLMGMTRQLGLLARTPV